MINHLDSHNRPHMVDVGDKRETERYAHAMTVVWLPAEVAAQFHEGDISSKKGPVFDTAILAGVMGAKRTSDLIPLCHPLPLSHCGVQVHPRPVGADGGMEIEIHCRVKTTGRTGVEMEALTGASVAALALYDMTKALSHAIVIRETRLLEKTGGKSDFSRKD